MFLKQIHKKEAPQKKSAFDRFLQIVEEMEHKYYHKEPVEEDKCKHEMEISDPFYKICKFCGLMERYEQEEDFYTGKPL
jgi:hypothetical protein